MRRTFGVRALLATAGVTVAAVAFAASAGAANSGARAVDPGLKVFQSAGCGGCHTLLAGGGKGAVGPNLDKAKPTAALVIARVSAGKGAMPSFKGRLNAVQIAAVAKFVSTSAGKKGVTPPPAATTAAKTTAPAATTSAPAAAPATPAAPETLLGDPVAGAAVFTSSGCGACHTLAAAGSNGAVGPNLDGRKPTQLSVKAVVQAGAIAGGAQMPAFNLSATDLNNLAAYVYKSTH